MNQFENTVTSPTDQEDINGSLISFDQLHTEIQTAQTELQSSGNKLGDILFEHSSKHPPPKTFSLDVMASPNISRQTRIHSGSTIEITAKLEQKSSLDEIDGQLRNIEEKYKSWDILDSKHEPIPEEVVTKPSTDSPKLLVAPRRAKMSGIKAAKSMPSLGPVSRDQETIDRLLEGVCKRANEINELWTDKNKKLKMLKEMASFHDNVLKVTKWVETVGEKFLDRKSNLGGSIEEVRERQLVSLLAKIDSIYKKKNFF